MYKFVDFYNLDSTENQNLPIYVSIADIFTNGIYIVKDVK